MCILNHRLLLLLTLGSIMDNLDKLLLNGGADFCHMASLCVHVKTAGIYESRVEVKPFDFEVVDISGSTSGRRLWGHCLNYEKLDYIVYVVDLNGYCQTLHNDHDAAS